MQELTHGAHRGVGGRRAGALVRLPARFVAATLLVLVAGLDPSAARGAGQQGAPTFEELTAEAERLRKQQDWKGAVEAWTRAAEACGAGSFEAAHAWIRVAEAQTFLGDPQPAATRSRAAWTIVAASDRAGDEAGLTLGVTHVFVLSSAGELEEATEIARGLAAAIDGRALVSEGLRYAIRTNYGACLRQVGEPSEALRVFEQLVSELEGDPRASVTRLCLARQNLAACLADGGDLWRARTVLDAAWQSVADRPPSSRTVELRMTLAGVLSRLGDHGLARQHLLETLASWSASLSPVLRSGVLTNLAVAEAALGETERARLHVEEALDLVQGRLPEGHPQLTLTRDVRDDIAADLQRDVVLPRLRAVEEYAQLYPPDHPFCIGARQDLARAYTDAGDRTSARQVLADLVADLETFTTEYAKGSLATARWSLSAAHAALGEVEEGRRVARAAVEELLSDLRREMDVGAPRLVRTRLESFGRSFGVLLTQALGGADAEPDRALLEGLFTLDQVREGLSLRRARAVRSLTDEQRGGLVEARRELARAVAAGESPAVVRAALEAEERIWSASTSGRAREEPPAPLPTPAAVAARLEEGEAVVVLRTAVRHGFGRAGDAEWVFVAFLLARDRELRCVELGRAEDLDEVVAAWREVVRAPHDGSRGLASAAGSAEGSADERIAALGSRIRALALDPVLELLGDSIRHVVVLNDGSLHAVPWDALPRGEGLVGDDLVLETRTSLWSWLLEGDVTPRGHGELVAVGGVEYGEGGRFTALPGAEREVLDLRAAPPSRVRAVHVLGGADAGPVEVARLAPRARWLHLATHGYAPPDPSVSGASGSYAVDGIEDLVPSLQSGLALSGANRTDDGGAAGVVTAHELSAWDLTGCDLVVLSACDTARGVVRRGQGVDSLQRAVLEAGARSVLASLWPVPDEATRVLMQAFYERLWRGLPKDRALWEAKRVLRAASDEDGRGRYGLRDWAGWVLYGAPD